MRTACANFISNSALLIRYNRAMKPFAELTDRGQAHRLRALAFAALAAYDLVVKQLRFITIDTNTLFRVDTADGSHYALRICTPGEHTLRDNLAEVAWLNALAHETEVKVPTPIANRAGAYVTMAQVEGVPEERRCVLFAWVPGATLDRHLSVANYRKLGIAAAHLHDHAATFTLPSDLQPMRWDRVFLSHTHQALFISTLLGCFTKNLESTNDGKFTVP